MARKRKEYTEEEKLSILRKYLLEVVTVSDICDENGLQSTVFYRWQKQLFEEGLIVFRWSKDIETKELRQQVTQLEEKLVKKNEVLGELLEEYVAQKKNLGYPERSKGAPGNPRSSSGHRRRMGRENQHGHR